MHFNDKNEIIALTPLWKGERLPDGRPKVDEKYLKALRTLLLKRCGSLSSSRAMRASLKADFRPCIPTEEN